HDLSARDPWFILPLIMAVAMFVQYKLNPTPPDPVQAKVFMIMPLVMSATFAFFPAGLVLYWVTNTVLSIAQQWNINRRIGALVAKRSQRGVRRPGTISPPAHHGRARHAPLAPLRPADRLPDPGPRGGRALLGPGTRTRGGPRPPRHAWQLRDAHDPAR